MKKVTIPLLTSREANILIDALVNHPNRLGDGRDNDTVRDLQSRIMVARDLLLRMEEENMAHDMKQARNNVKIED